DRAADRLLRGARAAAPLRRHAQPDRGPRPHPRHGRDAAARGRALVRPGRAGVIIKKSRADIDKMAAAGAIHVGTLKMLAGMIRPGVTTAELDAAAEEFIRSKGAVPSFKGYRGFPASICASPNDMVVHGIPGPYELQDGDIISIDVGVTYRGWVADGAVTFPVGSVTPV